jgi:hypothetical protein
MIYTGKNANVMHNGIPCYTYLLLSETSTAVAYSAMAISRDRPKGYMGVSHL